MPSRTLLLKRGRMREEETDPGVHGIDQSLAITSATGQRLLGTKLVRFLVELLFNDPEVS